MFARFSVVNRKLFLGKYKEEPTMSVTAKQRRIYDFIRRYIESNQEAPTIAEIGRQFQMRSSASVHAVLIALEREGLIKRIPNVSRGMEIVKQEESDDEDNEIPLLGTVAAGQPIEAILSHDVISVPKDLHGHGRTFALRVRGDSMIEENIRTATSSSSRHKKPLTTVRWLSPSSTGIMRRLRSFTAILTLYVSSRPTHSSNRSLLRLLNGSRSRAS